MRCNQLTINTLFAAQAQYEIHPLLRHYVWGWNNWQRLWDDLVETMEDDNPSAQHFLGTIMVTPQADKLRFKFMLEWILMLHAPRSAAATNMRTAISSRTGARWHRCAAPSPSAPRDSPRRDMASARYCAACLSRK